MCGERRDARRAHQIRDTRMSLRIYFISPSLLQSTALLTERSSKGTKTTAPEIFQLWLTSISCLHQGGFSALSVYLSRQLENSSYKLTFLASEMGVVGHIMSIMYSAIMHKEAIFLEALHYLINNNFIYSDRQFTGQEGYFHTKLNGTPALFSG